MYHGGAGTAFYSPPMQHSTPIRLISLPFVVSIMTQHENDLEGSAGLVVVRHQGSSPF